MATTETTVLDDADTDPDPDPVDHYRRNEPLYDLIEQRLDAVYDAFERADRPTQRSVLDKAVTFALISAQTSVDLHERAYIETHDTSLVDHDTIADRLLDAGANYYKNKASYIVHNRTQADYDAVLDHYDAGRIDRMHRVLADECKGVGLRKAGFALALAVTGRKCCIDTHVAQQAGVGPEEIYTGVVVDRYEAQCDHIFEQWDRLRSEYDLSRFLCQWIVFDTNLDAVTMHDPWFLSLPDEFQVQVES